MIAYQLLRVVIAAAVAVGMGYAVKRYWPSEMVTVDSTNMDIEPLGAGGADCPPHRYFYDKDGNLIEDVRGYIGPAPIYGFNFCPPSPEKIDDFL